MFTNQESIIKKWHDFEQLLNVDMYNETQTMAIITGKQL